MREEKERDVIVIGAGAAGLVVAIGLAKAHRSVLLIEQRHYGGECTHTGCVPSKALIACAKHAHSIRKAEQYGIEVKKQYCNADGALKYVRERVQQFHSHEDAAALQALGIETITAHAHFDDPHTLILEDNEGKRFRVRGKQIVIATGSKPEIPSIEGLKQTPCLTNETVFDLESIPTRFIFIGAGPTGCELAQAFSRLGAQVFLVDNEPMPLLREDHAARRVIRDQLQSEGLHLYLGQTVKRVYYDEKDFFVELLENGTGKETQIQASQLFVAVGRRPALHDLQLHRAEVIWSKKGVRIDRYGRTSQKHIWAAGDVVGAPFFSHRAENQARTVLRNLLFPFKQRISLQPLPRVTYTFPEVASIGLLEEEAERQYGEKKIEVYSIPAKEIERNAIDGEEEGFVKIITKRGSSRIIGATIVHSRAGEIMMQIVTAMHCSLPLSRFSSLIHPYPIANRAIRKAADLWFIRILLSRWHWLVRKKVWLVLLPLLLFALCYTMDWTRWLSFEQLQGRHLLLQIYVREHPIITALSFIGLYVSVVIASLPGATVLTVLGGFLFGSMAMVHVVFSATLGATLLFIIVKTALADVIRKKGDSFLARMARGFQKNAALYLLSLRLIPLFPFWAVNIAPAFFSVPLWTYIWTTVIGILPGTYLYIQAGKGVRAIFEKGGAFTFSHLLNHEMKITLIALGGVILLTAVIKQLINTGKSDDR